MVSLRDMGGSHRQSGARNARADASALLTTAGMNRRSPALQRNDVTESGSRATYRLQRVASLHSSELSPENNASMGAECRLIRTFSRNSTWFASSPLLGRNLAKSGRLSIQEVLTSEPQPLAACTLAAHDTQSATSRPRPGVTAYTVSVWYG